MEDDDSQFWRKSPRHLATRVGLAEGQGGSIPVHLTSVRRDSRKLAARADGGSRGLTAARDLSVAGVPLFPRRNARRPATTSGHSVARFSVGGRYRLQLDGTSSGLRTNAFLRIEKLAIY